MKEEIRQIISPPVEPASSLYCAVGQSDVLSVDWDDGSPGEMSNFGKSGSERAKRRVNNIVKEDQQDTCLTR